MRSIALTWGTMPVLLALLPFAVFPLIGITLRQTTKRPLHWMGLWRIPVLLAGEPEACARAIEIFSSERFPGLRSVGCVSSSRLLGMSGAQQHRRLLARYGAVRLLLVLDTYDQHGQAVIEHVTRTRLPSPSCPRWGGCRWTRVPVLFQP